MVYYMPLKLRETLTLHIFKKANEQYLSRNIAIGNYYENKFDSQTGNEFLIPLFVYLLQIFKINISHTPYSVKFNTLKLTAYGVWAIFI